MKHHPSQLLCALLAATALALAACGGGSDSSGGAAATSSASGASAGAESTGAISAFGSVFVNGHEFDTHGARVIDDDTGASTSDTSGLEVGMAVDVKSALASTAARPIADEIHVHPLVRGIVDASDSSGGTLTVLGQSVQLTAATNFSDHRACVTATTSPCTAVAGQADLSATTGSGSTATKGSYVTVHGYLYASSATTGTANIVATLVSVGDAPAAGAAGVGYKAEGPVSAIGSGTLTIGGLTVNLASATCYAGQGASACAGAFSVGQVVSAYGSAAPTLPATTLTATVARLRSKLAVQTAGTSVELEGKVSSVSSSPASFVIRGVTVDASALTTPLPAVGDDVRVLGTVATGGTSVTASSVSVLHAALSATVGLEGNVDSVVVGTAADTYTLTLLGQSVTVGSGARLVDLSSRAAHSGGSSATTNPFNITTFQSYLAASASQHVLIRAQADASGALSALSVTIVPASTASAVGGIVDATPAPANSTVTGTPTTFSIRGIAVSADPSSIARLRNGRGSSTAATIAAGDLVLARGTYAAGVLTVAAKTGTGSPSATAANFVLDSGVPVGHDRDCF